MSDFWRGYLVYACCAVLSACIVLVAMTCVVAICTGCGPRVVQPPIPAGVQWVLPTPTEGELEAEMQAPPVYQPAPQRVFIHRWLVPGGRNNPAPIGYIDLP